jgi:hypothetical protein
MKNSGLSETGALSATALMSLVATVLLVLNYDGTWMHPDTAQALSVARNLQQGHGFKTSIIYYEEHYALNTWPAPQTVFPLGYPSLIALLGQVGIPLRSVPFAVGVTGFLCIPLLISLAALRMGRQPMTATLLSALWLCCPMIWHNVWERQTESLFIALTLASLILLQSKTIKYRTLLLAGLLAAIAITLRYAGVFWLMSAGLAFLIQFSQQRLTAVRQAIAFSAIPVAVAAFLFARNIILVGDLKGGSTKEVHRSFKVAAENTWHAASRLIGLDKTNLLSGHPAEVAVFVGLCLLAIAVFVGLWRHSRPNDGMGRALPATGHSAAFLYIIVSLAALICLEKTTSINLSPRMLFPIIPFSLLACSDVFSRTLTGSFCLNKTGQPLRGGVVFAGVLLISGVLCGQFRAAEEVRGYVHRFGLINEIVGQPIETSTGTIEPREILKNMRILSDEPDMLGETIQQGIVGLISATYSNRIWTDDEVIALIRRYRINRIVVFPDVQPKEENLFFESLTTDADSGQLSRPWLQPIIISPRIQIYAVRESLLLTQQI